MLSPSCLHALLVPACLAGMPLFAAAAELAPVQTGLWEVQSLTTFERAASPASPASAPTLTAAEAPRPHGYRICIGPTRARSPMLPPRLPRAAELLFDKQGFSGSYTQRGADGARQQVEFSYRRLGATSFEGSHDVQGPQRVARTQYFVRHVAADCGALRASMPQASGEP